MVASDVPSQHRGGVEIFYWELPHFAVEAHQNQGMNIIRFHMATGTWLWLVVGCYLVPYDNMYIQCIVRGDGAAPPRGGLIVGGVPGHEPRGSRDEQ